MSFQPNGSPDHKILITYSGLSLAIQNDIASLQDGVRGIHDKVSQLQLGQNLEDSNFHPFLLIWPLTYSGRPRDAASRSRARPPSGLAVSSEFLGQTERRIC